MNKKYLLLVIAIIVAIVAAMSLNGEEESSTEDKVFKFSDFTITCPPGSHYENQSGLLEFYTENSENPALSIGYNSISGLEFDQFIRGSELLNNEQVLSIFNNENLFGMSDKYTVNDYNITEFKNHTTVDIYLSEGNTSSVFHVVKLSDSKVLLINEYNPNSITSKIYNSITFR